MPTATEDLPGAAILLISNILDTLGKTSQADTFEEVEKLVDQAKAQLSMLLIYAHRAANEINDRRIAPS